MAGKKSRGDAETAAFAVTRRGFIKATTSSVATASLFQVITGCDGCDDPAKGEDSGFEVVRADDLLVLRFRFVNLDRSGDELVRRDDGLPSLIIIELPRQHVLEEALLDGSSPTPPPLKSRISGHSRVVFELPEDVSSLAYSLESILAVLPKSKLVVSKEALPPDSPASRVVLTPQLKSPGVSVSSDVVVKPDYTAAKALPPDDLIQSRRAVTNAKVVQAQAPDVLPLGVPNLTIDKTPKEPVEPTHDETSIELPFRVLISPNAYGRFTHQVKPQTSESGWVELWHTRLGTETNKGEVDERDHPLRTIRALWVRGQPFDPSDPMATTGGDNTPFRASLSPIERNWLVHQTSNYTLNEPGKTKPTRPEPAKVDRLMLSALGGYLDARGTFKEKAYDPLIGWTHRATLGRDHFVRTEIAGFLYPFGHRASLITITERRIGGSPQTAYLWKRYFLVIREPVKRFDAGENLPGLGPLVRQMPFVSIAHRSLITPNLDEPADKTKPFVPSIGGKPLSFAMQGVDRLGRLVRMDAPLVWVLGEPNTVWSDAMLQARKNKAIALYVDPLKIVPFAGQRFALADSATDNTTFEIESLTFAVADLNTTEKTSAGYTVPFYPYVAEATLALEAARAFAGAASNLSYKFHDRYKSFGFKAAAGQNPGEVLLETVGGALGVDFGAQSDRSGGFLTPSLSVTGISRRSGPVGGALDKIADDAFSPEEFFKGALPKLFGAIALTDILDLGQALDKAPKFVTETLNEVESLINDLARLQKTLAELQAKVSGLKTQADALSILASNLVGKIGEGDVTFVIGPDGLTKLVSSLTSFKAAILAQPSVPPGLARATRESIERLLSVLSQVSALKKALERFRDAEELVKNQTVRLEFRPQIKGDPLGIFHPNKSDGLLLLAELRGKAVGNRPAGADLVASLEDFDINLIGSDPVFVIGFERIQFISRAGKKPDVDVVMKGLGFGGPLKFIERIKEIIPLDGFSDPPALDVSSSGIKASFTLPLPNVAIGVFSLENLSISAGFEIPFLGDALAVMFKFCTRENPFTLTVSALGGGGFVGIEMTPKGIRLLEASLEFGACLSVDFGVASGGVSIMAGVYFALEGDDCTLSGYLRIRGEVDVLGLISACIELYMELSYETASGKVIGRATLTIEVEVFCFSASVELSVERRFAGSNGDPTFAEVMAPCLSPALPTDLSCVTGVSPWAEYVNAFA